MAGGMVDVFLCCDVQKLKAKATNKTRTERLKSYTDNQCHTQLQEGVTPIDSIVTAETARSKLDQLLSAF